MSYCHKSRSLTHLLEVGPGSEDFMHKVFDREDVVFTEGLFNNLVVGERYSLLIDPTVTTLVDQFADGLQVRLATLFKYSSGLRINNSPVGDVRLNKAEHLLSRSCDLDEDAVVNLEEAEQL